MAFHSFCWPMPLTMFTCHFISYFSISVIFNQPAIHRQQLSKSAGTKKGKPAQQLQATATLSYGGWPQQSTRVAADAV